jgi:hypothetical protein
MRTEPRAIAIEERQTLDPDSNSVDSPFASNPLTRHDMTCRYVNEGTWTYQFSLLTPVGREEKIKNNQMRS